AVRFLGETCGVLCVSCGPAELPRRDADDAPEVVGELALVREAGARGDFRQREVAFSQKLLCPFDAAGRVVLVRRQASGRLELRGEGVGAEMGCRRHLLQGQAAVEVFLDVFDDGAELPQRERTVRSTGRGAEALRIRWTASRLARDSAASRS